LAKDYASAVNWDVLFSDGTLQFSTVLANFDVPNEVDTNIFEGFTAAQQALVGVSNYALDCSGYINIPETGLYSFSQYSDDGSELAINNTVLINMPQAQSFAGTTVSNVQLFSGLNRINVLYFQGPVTNIGLELSWQGPANAGLSASQIVPASAFTH
jgi:hypothetical protein